MWQVDSRQQLNIDVVAGSYALTEMEERIRRVKAKNSWRTPDWRSPDCSRGPWTAPEEVCGSERSPHCSDLLLEELQAMDRTHAGEVCEGVSSIGGTPHCSRLELWISHEKEWNRHGLKAIPTLCLPVCWQQGGSKAAHEKRGEVGGGDIFKIWLHLSLPYFDSVGSFLELLFKLNWTYFPKWSKPSLRPWSLLLYFLFHIPSEGLEVNE